MTPKDDAVAAEWFTTDENERDLIKKDARLYVDEDWVDEIAQSNASINLKNVSEGALRIIE